MIEIKTSKNHLEKVKFLKEFQLFLKLEKPSNHWPKWVWKNSFIKKLVRYTPSEVGTIEFDGRVYDTTSVCIHVLIKPTK
jgi:hypothetical protein